MARRYFQHSPTGRWYAGLQTIGGTFSSDGTADAAAIASALNLAAGSVIPVTLADTDADPRGGTLLSDPATPPVALDADGQRVFDYMPISGSQAAQLVSTFIADTTKDPAIRATMAALRSLIRKTWKERES